MTMKTSLAGVAAIRQREGCRLTAYRDVVGVWTIGVGHTGRATPPAVTAGMTIIQAQADAMLAADLAPFEAAINKAVARPMTQNQFDAMASLAFNIGAGGFLGSTVVRKFNAGDPAGAADAFLLWEKPAALRARRIGERAQFLSTRQPEAPGVASANPTAAPFYPPHVGVTQPPIAAPAPQGLFARVAAYFSRRPAA